MRPYFTRLYTIGTLILFAGCGMPPKQAGTTVKDTVTTTAAITPLAGQWYNDENIYGCMHLEINDTGRFVFCEESSHMRRYSEGSCRREGDHIRLTSFGRYKHSPVPPNTYFNPEDTAFIYLNNEHYLLDKDTLFKLDAGGFKTDAKFHRLKAPASFQSPVTGQKSPHL